MSKYFEAIQPSHRRGVRTSPGEIVRAPEREARAKTTIAISEPASSLWSDLARDPSVRQLAEQLAPLAVVEGQVRVLVSGCRPGDGASTIAAALALDLSQRLGVRTVLLEGRQSHHVVKPQAVRPGRDTNEIALGAQVALLQPSGWPQLDTLSYAIPSEAHTAQHFQDLGNLLDHYQAAVMDLGVVRLDARVLNFTKPEDPVLIVVRQGQTERQELASTVHALQATRRRIGGVVLNAYESSLPAFIRRLMGIGGGSES